MTSASQGALKAAAILWVVWGLVHALAGIMIVGGDTVSAVQAIADAVEPSLLAMEYPAAVGGILNQHGWNIGWFGIVTIIGAVFMWRGSTTAIWVTALVGGLADIGYFTFVDMAGYANFFPGTVMTIISASAIVFSFGAWLFLRGAQPQG